MFSSPRLNRMFARLPRGLLLWLAAASVIGGWGASAAAAPVAARGLNSGTAAILLLAPGASLGSTVAVQYQDGLGQWHMVKGWSGSPLQLTDKAGAAYMQYAVNPANFGQGPFRWAIYDQQDGTLLALSADFNLPAKNGVNDFMAYTK